MNAPFAPQQASNHAYQYDVIFYLLTGLTAVFTILVATLVVVFAVRYRRGTKVDRSRPHHEHLMLELTWTAIPAVLGLGVFFLGARLFIQMKVPPPDAQEIFVIGKQWMWHMQHSNGVRENNTLHVPLGKPVKLTMISQDVIHAMYIPDFRVQYHVLPGRYTQLWFTATKSGRYPLYCNMYCGTQHSEMGGYVYVMEETEYAEWLANGGNNVGAMTLVEKGERLYKVLGCANNCHATTNTENAPSLHGIFDTQRQMVSGEQIKVDDAYLRESIIRPWNKLTAGYTNTMPAYEKQISEEDILALNAYIKSLAGAAGEGEAAGGTNPGDDSPAVNAVLEQGNQAPGATDLERTGPAVNAGAAQKRIESR